MTTPAEMLARFEGIFIAASEQVLREIYAEDRRGEPPPSQIEASREAAISLFKLVVSMGPPPTAAQAEASAKTTDEALMAKALEVLRPKIRRVMAPVRPA